MRDDEPEDRAWASLDEEDGEDDPTEPCPYCGELVYDDAERCPSCERYLSREDAPRSRPTWVVVGVILCLAVVVFWIVGS